MLSESLRKDSKWAPYFAVLPRELDSLVFWSEPEIKELQASAVVTKIGKGTAEEMFTQHIAPLGLDNYSIEMCHRVASVIMAYAFDIPEEKTTGTMDDNEGSEGGDDLVSDDEEEEKTVLSMVPLADMLNADADRNNARLCCDNEELEMRTIKPIAAGEEIFNDYGPLPRSDLLRRYGYITDQYAVYDVVEISTESMLSAFRTGGRVSPNLQLNSEDLEKRVELTQREDVYDQSYDIRHAGPEGPSIPDELLAFLYILLLDEENLAAISSSQSYLPSRSKMATETLGQVLVTLLRLREEEYATTLEEDEALLKSENLPNRTRMAIEVRLGEKKVIREAIQEASSFSGSNKRMRGGQNPEGQIPGEKGKRRSEESSHPKKKRRFG
jgi:SET domain-containing protein 6